MSLQTATRERVRPPRPNKERGRTRGVRREQLAFKADQQIRDYVEAEAKQEGWGVTGVLNDMVATQIDLERALSGEWLEIEARAVRERISKGKVLAGLVLAALRAERRK